MLKNAVCCALMGSVVLRIKDITIIWVESAEMVSNKCKYVDIAKCQDIAVVLRNIVEIKSSCNIIHDSLRKDWYRFIFSKPARVTQVYCKQHVNFHSFINFKKSLYFHSHNLSCL
jgi:hypothetical protein